jgi:hypothetical protein
MKPLNGLKGLGIKSARGAGSLSKKALMYTPNSVKDRGLSGFNSMKDIGISHVRNSSSYLDNRMTKKEGIKKIGRKAWLQQQADKSIFGGKEPNVNIKNETIDSLKQKKAMDSARLQSKGSSVEEIKLSGDNWNIKIAEKGREVARENLNKANPSERGKMTEELNSKRAAFAKSKENKAKHMEEFRNVQLGKSVKAEESSQLKDVKEFMDSAGTGENVDLSKDFSDSIKDNGKVSSRANSDTRNQIMATLIAKVKNNNVGSDDEKFIEANSVFFNSFKQDVQSLMNSEVANNSQMDKENPEKKLDLSKLKQKIKNPGPFDLGDKEESVREKGKGYIEYQKLIDDTFAKINNVETNNDRDKILKDLEEKDVLDDFKESFKQQANLVIQKRDLKQKTAEISGRNQKLNSIIGTSDSDEEYEMRERGDISKLEKEVENEKHEYENLKKKVSSYKKEDLKLGILKKKKVENNFEETSEEKFQEEFINNFSEGMENNPSNFNKIHNSQKQSESQYKNQKSGNQESGKQTKTQKSKKSEDDLEEQIKKFDEFLKQKKGQNKGKSYKETMEERKGNSKNVESEKTENNRGSNSKDSDNIRRGNKGF